MKTSIEFIEGIKEKNIPFIKMTRSKNGKTGTATFIFISPLFFSKIGRIQGMALILDKKKIVTTNLEIIFKNGKPYLARAIIFLKNTEEWFDFLTFINIYSNENDLLFSEKKGWDDFVL